MNIGTILDTCSCITRGLCFGIIYPLKLIQNQLDTIIDLSYGTLKFTWEHRKHFQVFFLYHFFLLEEMYILF